RIAITTFADPREVAIPEIVHGSGNPGTIPGQKSAWGKSGCTECGPDPEVREARLNKAALRRRFRVPGVSGMCEGIRLGHKEINYDPPSQNDARRTRASSLRSDYHRLLHPNDRGFCALLSAPS